MLGSFLDKLGGLFDQRFIIAYWMPTFIVLSTTIGLVGGLIGPLTAFNWWTNLSGLEQILLGIGTLFATSIVAYLFAGLSIPLIRLFEGYWPDGQLKDKACDRQQKSKKRASETNRYYNFPFNSQLVKPTQLGNVLAAAEEYPYRFYQLDAPLWWPRLVPLLPETYRTQLDNALTPMITLLNLSIVFTLIAMAGSAVVLLINPIWWLIAAFLGGGLLLARVFYIAASNQALNYGMLIRVAFDLYRHEIFKQMHIRVPDNYVDERLLWTSLNEWLARNKMPWESNEVLNLNLPQLVRPFFYDTHQPSILTTEPQEKTLRDRGSSEN